MLVGAAPGATADIIESISAEEIPGGFILEVTVWGPYRNRYIGIFQDGLYKGSFWVDLSGIVKVMLPFSAGNSFGTIYIEDLGDWAVLEGDEIPTEDALLFELDTADRITFRWDAPYKLAPTVGDNQLSNIVITGAVRNLNCAQYNEFPTRALLTYTIDFDGPHGFFGVPTTIIKWWNGNELVAMGSRVGIGPIECVAQNSSGLTITADITPTGFFHTVSPSTALVEIRWPFAYQIHYLSESSTEGELIFPRTPEAIQYDNGGDSFVFQTPRLASGVYHVAIVTVDDEGNEEASPVELSDSPKTIIHPPLPPTNLAVTTSITDNTVTLTWEPGEDGCTFELYASGNNTPVNLDTPIFTSEIDENGVTIADYFSTDPIDRTEDYNNLVAAFDSAASAAESDFANNASDFIDTLGIEKMALYDAMLTFGENVGLDLAFFITALENQFNTLIVNASALESTSPALTDFQALMTPEFGSLLSYLGNLLVDQPGRYALPDGTNQGGTPLAFTLTDAVTPLVLPARYTVVVRATKDGVQEKTDKEFSFELTADLTPVIGYPPNARIGNIGITNSFTMTVQVSTMLDNFALTPEFFDLYVVVHGAEIDFDTPVDSVAIARILNGYAVGTLSATVGGNGEYDVIAVCRTGSVRSASYESKTHYVSNDTPNAVLNASANVMRGLPNIVG